MRPLGCFVATLLAMTVGGDSSKRVSCYRAPPKGNHSLGVSGVLVLVVGLYPVDAGTKPVKHRL
jgi:hypothetical protein